MLTIKIINAYDPETGRTMEGIYSGPILLTDTYFPLCYGYKEWKGWTDKTGYMLLS